MMAVIGALVLGGCAFDVADTGEAVGWADLAVEGCAENEFEDNDTFEAASQIMPGDHSGLRSCAGDDDFYTIYNSFSSPTVTNCTFSDDGGMRNEHSFPTVTECTFSHSDGMDNYYSDPTVTGCTFTNNDGGMRNEYLATRFFANVG